MTSIEEIIRNITKLSFTQVMAYLAAHGITKFGGKKYQQLKQIIRDKYNESHFAFVPNKKEAQTLKELGKEPDYQTIIELVPKYSYHDIIRTGLLIRNYLSNPTKINKDRSKEIKTKIARRPNGKKLLNIVRLVTTPYFTIVIKNLQTLKLDLLLSC